MLMKPKLSVVMPTLNAATYLKESIDSILSQTFSNYEFLIVDDNSRDGTREIIGSYNDSRIILIDGPNKGISSALNVGIKMAQGEYIARMDADDISMPTRFEKQIQYLDTHPNCGMVGCKVTIFGDKTFTWNLETDNETLHTDMLFYLPCVHPTVMFRKSVLKDNNLLYNIEYSATEDYEFFARISKYTDIANIDEILLQYRFMKSNATNKNNDTGLPLYLSVMDEQFKSLGLNFSEEELKLLSVHYSIKGLKGIDVIKAFIKIDLLLKKIFIANEKSKIYNRTSLFKTLHKRFKEVYDSLTYFCMLYDIWKTEELYQMSVFHYSEWYNPERCISPYFRDNEEPEISIIMPAYNAEEYILEAIWSLLVQTFSNFELLIIYDESVDSTLMLVQLFNDPRIRVIQNKEKMGIAFALNRGIKEARAELLARADADDVYPPERLEIQYNFMKAHPDVDLCGTWQRHFGLNADWVHRGPLEHDDIKAQLIYSCDLCHSTVITRKSKFIENDLFYTPDMFAEDYELWIRAIEIVKFVNIPQVLGYYRATENSITNKKKNKIIEEAGKLTSAILANKLHIYVPSDHTIYLQMWDNIFDSTLNKNVLKKHLDVERKILLEMWSQNEKYKVYNPDSLLKTINRRWCWINHTVQSGIIPVDKLLSNISYRKSKINKTTRKISNLMSLKRIIKKLFKPIWSRIKARLIAIIHEANSDILKGVNVIRNEVNGIRNEITIYKDICFSNLIIKKKIFLVGVPHHHNIGDTAITIGEYEFIKEYFSEYFIFELNIYHFESGYKIMQSIINNDDLIFLQGGGNLGNLYLESRDEEIRRKMVTDFPNNKIIILPQSIFFTDDEKGNQELEISAEIYNRHKNLKLLVRGFVSLEFAKKHFYNVKMTDALDLVLMLETHFNFDRKGILLCIKDLTDESGLNEEDHEEILKIVKKYDCMFEKSKNHYTGNIHQSIRKKVVDEEIMKFARHKIVITDRLHGLIFSVITKTPCVFIGGYYYKQTEFANYFSDSNAVFFLGKDMSKLDGAIQKAMSVTDCFYPIMEQKPFDKIYRFIID
jgi:exopolysaccharide biosynthesis predicted pyruvyltransferase EpsI/GT2 family glycosyltransferase